MRFLKLREYAVHEEMADGMPSGLFTSDTWTVCMCVVHGGEASTRLDPSSL